MADSDELDEVLDRAYNGEYALGDLIVSARSIRARERRLAELAREHAKSLREMVEHNGSQHLTVAEWRFLNKYDEAVK